MKKWLHVGSVIVGVFTGVVLSLLLQDTASKSGNSFNLSNEISIKKTRFANSFDLVKRDRKTGYIQIQGSSILFVAANDAEKLTVSVGFDLVGDERDVVSIIEIGDKKLPGEIEFHQVSGASWPPDGPGEIKKSGSLFYYFEEIKLEKE